VSKALTYKEAETIIEACVISGCGVPTFKWFMGKRRDYGWAPIIDAAKDVLDTADVFRESLLADTQRLET
jgi:hypothetical protein